MITGSSKNLNACNLEAAQKTLLFILLLVFKTCVSSHKFFAPKLVMTSKVILSAYKTQ